MTDMLDNEDFQTNGFLSSSAIAWTATHIENNAETFSRAYALNGIAQSLIYRSNTVSAEASYLELQLFAILFVRSISNFQASVSLLQKGMNLEAKILARSCLECTFMLGAARNMGAEFVTRIIKSHNRLRKVIGQSIQELHKKGAAFTDEQVLVVNDIVEKYEKDGIQTFEIFEMAQKAGLENWYIFYRSLSNEAAHPSLDSLQYFYSGKDHTIVFEPRSDADELCDIVDLLCIFLISCCKDFNEHLGEDTYITKRLDEEFRRVRKWQQYSKDGEHPKSS